VSVRAAIRASGSTWAAYRYHGWELIWARLSFSSGGIIYGDARGYIRGVPVYPSPEKYINHFDWQPWRVGHKLAAIGRPDAEEQEKRK
jgi:hypothetical protein